MTKNNIINVKPYDKSYTSLSYQMIADLLNSKQTPLYIRFKLYFGILQKYNKTIFCLNQYLADKFGVSIYQVKYHLKKLKDENSIKIINEGTFKRQIVLLEYVMISEEELKDNIRKKNEALKQSAFGKFAVKDNVYLSDRELMELKELMGSEYVKYINDLDSYIEKTGKKYKSHFETLKAWWYKNQKAKANKKKQEDTPYFLDEEEQFENYFDNDNDTWLGTPLEEWLKDFEENNKEA